MNLELARSIIMCGTYDKYNSIYHSFNTHSTFDRELLENLLLMMKGIISKLNQNCLVSMFLLKSQLLSNSKIKFLLRERSLLYFLILT